MAGLSSCQRQVDERVSDGAAPITAEPPAEAIGDDAAQTPADPARVDSSPEADSAREESTGEAGVNSSGVTAGKTVPEEPSENLNSLPADAKSGTRIFTYSAQSKTETGDSSNGTVTLTAVSAQASTNEQSFSYRSSFGKGSQEFHLRWMGDDVLLASIDTTMPDASCRLEPQAPLYRAPFAAGANWQWSSSCTVDLGGVTLKREITEKATVKATGEKSVLGRPLRTVEIERERLNVFTQPNGQKNGYAEIETEHYAPDLGIIVQRTTKTGPKKDGSANTTLSIRLESVEYRQR